MERGTGQQLSMTKKELYATVTHYVGRVTIGLAIVLVYSIAHLIKRGFGTLEPVTLVALVALSIPITILYGAFLCADRKTEKSYGLGCLVLAVMVPYITGIFICLFEGLWSFTHLLSGFSLFVILKAGIMTVIGFHVLGKLYYLTELCKGLDQGNIVIEN